MKKSIRYKKCNSIKDLVDYITLEMYTKQTIVNLFRCLLETIIEANVESVVLLRLHNPDEYTGLLNRLKYSSVNVVDYSDTAIFDEFLKADLPKNVLTNDEFLIVIADRFSSTLYWDESSADVFGLCQGFTSLNPYEANEIQDFLQNIAPSKKLDTVLQDIKRDRRANVKFTTILRKLVAGIESNQRDLICANFELKEFNEKTLHEEKNSAIGELCSTIAHEIRNPLGLMATYAKVICSNVEKIEKDVKDQESLNSIINATNVLLDSTENLEGLLTELIDYSKPMEIQVENCKISDVIDSVVNLVKPGFDEKFVDLKVKYGIDDSILLEFDKQKISQAILNVLKNALEVSTENDVVTIDIEGDLENDQIVIKVSDQGDGIAPEVRNKIFTPFFTTKKQGTGLGLARSRKIIEAHGGTMQLFSSCIKGTVMGVTLKI